MNRAPEEPAASPWWAAFGPAETELSCGDAKHRIRWADGGLHSLDHPDAEGELVLAALGGDTTPCLELVATWGRHSDDLGVLAIGPRDASDQLTIIAGTLAEIEMWRPLARRGWQVYPRSVAMKRRRAAAIAVQQFRATRAAPGVRGSGKVAGGPRPAAVPSLLHSPAPLPLAHRLLQPDPGQEAGTELIRLLALGAAFQFRLSATVAHAWSADGGQAGRTGRAGPALTAALTGRLAPAAARWLGIDAGQVEATRHDGPGWGELTRDRAGGGQRLLASLPLSWLARVWAPGLAVVGGHLIVSVPEATWPTARVLAIATPGADPVELSVRHDGRAWQVAR